MDQIKEHFSITELPFELTPNVDYFCQFKGHENALQILKICIEKGESLVKITGEVGTGKTLICRKLIQDIDAMGHITLYIYNPAFGAETLQRLVADELGIQYPDNATEHWLAKKTTEKLIEHHQQGKKVVLIIDEAQVLSDQALESLRLLTNLETQYEKLLQIVLFGQPELDEKLSQKNMRQMSQRIGFSYYLDPFKPNNVGPYITRRLLTAGHTTGQVFSRGASKLIYRASQGIPRVINILAYKAMLVAYSKGRSEVNVAAVREAIQDSQEVVKTVTEKKESRVAWLSLCVALVALSVFWLQRS